MSDEDQKRYDDQKHHDEIFIYGLKRVHIFIAVITALLVTGIGIGRFESKSSAQEARIAVIERTMAEQVNEFKSEVLRHLDDLEKESHDVSQRVNSTQDVIRNVAADVAVLCSKQIGNGCATRR